MKKIVLSLFLAVSMVLCVCTGCSIDYPIPEKPDDTTLEFWITQDVSSVDFSEYYEVLGWFGAREFYGKGYYPEEIVNEYGSVTVEPKYRVKYLVAAYPDVADGGQFITKIDITDPDITVYGLTCNSPLDEFDKTMKELGYTISEDIAVMHTATLGKIRFVLTSCEDKNELTIAVEVTNKSGIIF